jgi:hypothetical protein
MIKANDVSVCVYELSGKVRIVAQFGLNGFSIEKDESGRIIDEKRDALQKALEDALSKWEFASV